MSSVTPLTQSLNPNPSLWCYSYSCTWVRFICEC